MHSGRLCSPYGMRHTHRSSPGHAQSKPSKSLSYPLKKSTSLSTPVRRKGRACYPPAAQGDGPKQPKAPARQCPPVPRACRSLLARPKLLAVCVCVCQKAPTACPAAVRSRRNTYAMPGRAHTSHAPVVPLPKLRQCCRSRVSSSCCPCKMPLCKLAPRIKTSPWSLNNNARPHSCCVGHLRIRMVVRSRSGSSGSSPRIKQIHRMQTHSAMALEYTEGSNVPSARALTSYHKRHACCRVNELVGRTRQSSFGRLPAQPSSSSNLSTASRVQHTSLHQHLAPPSGQMSCVPRPRTLGRAALRVAGLVPPLLPPAVPRLLPPAAALLQRGR